MPYDSRDETSGQYTQEFTDVEFLAALDEQGGASTSAIADAVGCQYRTAYARLHDLNDAGQVTVREIGNSLLWEAVDTGDRDHPAEHEDREPDAAGLAGEQESTGDDSSTADSVGTEPHGTDNRTGDELLKGLDREEHMAAIEAAREYLRANGPASRQKLVSEVMPAYPLGLDVEVAFSNEEPGDQLRAAWWQQVIEPGLEALPNVDCQSSDASEWRYIDEDDEDTDNGDQDSDELPTAGGVYDPTNE